MKKTVLVFDLDGTLYSLLNEGGEVTDYSNSMLKDKVQAKARNLVLTRKLCNKQSLDRFMEKANLDPVGISQYLSNNFGIKRDEYFNEVWDINPEKLILFDSRIKILLTELKQKNTLILLTSAPKVWQQNIFKYLSLDSIFTKVYTGDTFKIKIDIFKQIKSNYPTQLLISFGDQTETDIVPANKLGYQTCLVKNSQDIINYFSPVLPYYIDTDMGNDDILAITLMLKNGLNIRGISTVFGVATAKQGARNISRIVNYLNLDIPVYLGKSRGLNKKWQAGFPKIDCLRANTLTLLEKLAIPDTNQNNTQKLDDLAKSIINRSTLVNLVALGPLTNIATIINKYGTRFTDKIATLTIMGGALDVPGIVPPRQLAEYNIYLDPQAANLVFSTPNLPITLVPLDATSFAPACARNASRQKVVSQYKKFMNTIEREKPRNRASKIIRSMIIGNENDFDSFYDPVAVAQIIQPSLIEKTIRGRVRVSTAGKNIGQTQILDQSKSLAVTVITKIDTSGFYQILIDNLSK